MNKKLFALMMVPVVVVMGGTFAFSAWSGAANAFFGQSAATVGYTETLTFDNTNAMYNNLTIGYTGGHSLSPVNMNTAVTNMGTKSGGASTTLNVYANVTNLVPGQYVHFTVTINNTASATLNVSSIGWAGGQAYNGNGQPISPTQPVSSLQPPVGPAYLSSVVQNGLSIPGGSGLIYLFNASTTSSTPGYLHPGDSLSYDVYAILPEIAPASLAGASFNFEISIPVSTVQ